MQIKTNRVNILMTVTDYGTRHNISRIAVNQKIKSGEVNAVKIGSMFLIEDYLNVGKVRRYKNSKI
jgi:hypothetical protein